MKQSLVVAVQNQVSDFENLLGEMQLSKADVPITSFKSKIIGIVSQIQNCERKKGGNQESERIAAEEAQREGVTVERNPQLSL